MRTKTPPPRLLTLTEVGKLTEIPVTTLRQWCAVGAVPQAIKPGHGWLIPENQVEAIRNREVSFGVRKNSRPNQPTVRRPARARPGFRPAAAGPAPETTG